MGSGVKGKRQNEKCKNSTGRLPGDKKPSLVTPVRRWKVRNIREIPNRGFLGVRHSGFYFFNHKS